MVPTLYDRQAIRLDIRSLGLTSIRIQVCDFKVFAGALQISGAKHRRRYELLGGMGMGGTDSLWSPGYDLSRR